MSEVSCRTIVPLIAYLRARGIAPEQVVAGLPFTVEQLETPSQRVAWTPYTQLLERCAEALGHPDEIEQAAFEHAGDYVPNLLRALLPRFVGPRPIYVYGARWIGPWLYLSSRGVCEDLPDGRLVQRIEILPEFRECSLFFRGMRGVLRATPELLGLGSAVVEMEEDGRRAEYTISPPPSHTLVSRVRRRLSDPRWAPADLDELGFQQEQLRASYRAVRRTSEELAEKSRRLERLNGLGRELTRHTETGPLLEAVVDVLERHFAIRGIRVSREALSSERPESLVESGDLTGPPSEAHELRAAGRAVGRLEIWSGPAAGGDHESALLRELLPWIGIALENARSFEVLSQQTRRLEQEVSERRRAEEQLERAQRLDSMGRLAGGIAHDFNNILTAISGYAELAGSSLGGDHPAREDIDGICEMCDRAADLLLRLLTFSRQQPFVAHPVDLGELVTRMQPMLRRLLGERIDLVVDVAPGSGFVMADAGQLEQVLINLVVNSRDAMADGGRVAIEVDTETELAAEGEPRFVVCRVTDTGAGMDEVTRSQIFEPFFTTKEPGKGTGLGLSTAYGTVTQFGGTITAESEAGKSTSIAFRLPRLDPAAAEAAAAAFAELPSAGPTPGGDGTLLLVDDEEAVRRVARRILEQKGYTVLEAAYGPDALAICEGRTEPIDLLVTDIVMPEMDGRELARRALRMRPELRGVLFVSGYASEGMPGELAPNIAHELLRKPFQSPSLLGAVSRLLNPEGTAEFGGVSARTD